MMLGFLAILILVVAILQATVSYGLFTLQKWSYILTLIVYGIAGAVGLLGILAASSRQNTVQQVPNIVAAVVVILYFSQPRVKAYFEKYGTGPPVVKIGKNTGMKAGEICRLFPCGVVRGAYRLAGLPRPPGCF